ncbi:hypothetical protein BB934_25695 [Microvirga ossetica]|uniref:Uncharacterized protein n=2 Tax=Microvirga ossetica TaxID=1882682 RepID=A0A1B2EMW7_9HYPH|nr:hypothetical protein BB934_25695 [Microvirga ossetica]
MALAADAVVSNGWSRTTTSRSGYLASQVALDAPQREQQVDLVVGDGFSLDVGKDGLEMGPKMLSRIRGKGRSCWLLVRTSLVTHELTYRTPAPAAGRSFLPL